MNNTKPHHQYAYAARCRKSAEPGTINYEEMVADTDAARLEVESDIKTLVEPKFSEHYGRDIKHSEIQVSFRYVGEVR